MESSCLYIVSLETVPAGMGELEHLPFPDVPGLLGCHVASHMVGIVRLPLKGCVHLQAVRNVTSWNLRTFL